jgi:antitoxin HicB
LDWILLEEDMKYTIIIEPEKEGGYSVAVPALPGCFSHGDTIEHARQNIKEAIECHLESLRTRNKPIPKERTSFEVHVERVSVKIPA